MILMNYRHVPTICIGDMNSRFGDPPTTSTNISHKSNPDIVRNTNSNKLLEMLSHIKSFHILNGLQYHSLKCDSEFTFFRGKLCSQNGIALSNCIEHVVYF